MKGFSFESFDVTLPCRPAFEACRHIAEGEYAGARPIVLLGVEGAGKSHLLWSIVKAVRASSRPVGLALIMAREFPDRVRNLATDPAPIRQGKPAILLVDDLQHFRERAPELEAVVRVFLEQDHDVVLASNVHPDRIVELSEDFKDLLRGGRIFELRPRRVFEAEGEPPAGLTLTDIWRELSALRRERDDLERELRDKATLEKAFAELQARLELSQAEEERLNRALSEMPPPVQEMPFDEPPPMAPTVDDPQLAVLQLALRQAEADAENAFAEQARLQGQLGATRRALETAESSQAQMQEENARLRQQAESVLAQLQTHQQALAEQQDNLQASIDDLVAEATARQRQEHEAARLQWERELMDARALAEAYRAQLNELQSRSSVELAEAMASADHAETLLEEARAELGRVNVMADTARGRLGAMEFELEKARRQLALQMAEMDALRETAATQAANASIEAGARERRLVELEAALEAAQSLGGTVDHETSRLSEDLERLAGTARHIGAVFGHLKQIEPPATPLTPLEDLRQRLLFDSELFESIPGAEPLPGTAGEGDAAAS
jgi:predicted  nucleic acid-binding Zn-ribbon protein